MSGRWQRWVEFWNERETPEAMALLRITFGAAMVANVVEQLIRGNILEFYAEAEYGGIFTYAYNNSPYSLFKIFPPTATNVYVLVYLQLLAAVGVLFGFHTRFSTLVWSMLQITFYDRMVLFRFDGDNIFKVFSYLLLLSPAGAAYSVDALWRGKGLADIPKWPRRLFMAQLAIVYTRTGVVKLGSSWSFIDGWSAVYLALNLPGIDRWPGDWAQHPLIYPFTQIGTFISSWWELLFFVLPINVYLRRDPARGGRFRQALARYDLRPIFWSVGLMMHGQILLFMDIGLFSVVMLSLYPAYVKPEEARRVLEWAKAKLFSKPAPAR